MNNLKLNRTELMNYPYGISIRGQEILLLKEKELLDLYSQISESIMNEELLED